MPGNKSEACFPLGKTSRTRRHAVFDRWFRDYPILRLAYRRLCDRVGSDPNVNAVGIGIKYSEKARRYVPTSSFATGNLCLKVFVRKKGGRISGGRRVPRWLSVSDPHSGKTYRVPTDVVTAGVPQSECLSPGKLQSGRGWPAAGCIDTGRLFAFGRDKASATPPKFGEKDVRLGTTGGLIRLNDKSLRAISAGHVFTTPCEKLYACPDGVRAIGTKGRGWYRLDGSSFFPSTVLCGKWVRDVMSFRVPNGCHPTRTSWPDGFLRELATQEDVDQAIQSTAATGFIWVERKGSARPVPISVDLEAGLPFFKTPVECGTSEVEMQYGMTWPLRFRTSDTTIGGDSGSGVFLWTEDNCHCRLLGFHFMRRQNLSYAMDAAAFFREAMGAVPNKDFEFA